MLSAYVLVMCRHTGIISAFVAYMHISQKKNKVYSNSCIHVHSYHKVIFTSLTKPFQIYTATYGVGTMRTPPFYIHLGYIPSMLLT